MNEQEPKLQPEKIRIVPLAAGAATLGYRISAVMARPSERSVNQLQGKFRSLTERHETRRLAEIIRRVMSMARGWAHYFRLAGRSPVLDEIGKWILVRRKAHATQRHWVWVWDQKVPTSSLYAIGLRPPYHIVTSCRS